MTAPEVIVILLACVPAVWAVTAAIQARIARHQFVEQIRTERRESLDAYEADDEVTARRYSFSGWPSPNKRPNE